MGLQYDPSPGLPWCGYGRKAKVARWESWLLLGLCVALVLIGWLIGGR